MNNKPPPDRKRVKVRIVRDAIGGAQMETVNGELLENVFIQQVERLNDSVSRVNVEVIFLTNKTKVKNW